MSTGGSGRVRAVMALAVALALGATGAPAHGFSGAAHLVTGAALGRGPGRRR